MIRRQHNGSVVTVDSGQRFRRQGKPFRKTSPLEAVEGQEVIPLRLIVPAVVTAAAAAGGFTSVVTPPVQIEADQRLPPTAPNWTGLATGALASMNHRTSEEEKAAAAFQRAAEAILRRAPNTRPFASIDEPPINGPIPLPRRRPIARR